MECAAGSWYRCRKPPTRSESSFSLRVRWERAAPVLWQGFILGNVRIWILDALCLQCQQARLLCAMLCTFNCIILHRTWIWKNISSSCDEDLIGDWGISITSRYHRPRMVAKMMFGASNVPCAFDSSEQVATEGSPWQLCSINFKKSLCVRIQWLRIVSGNAWTFVRFSWMFMHFVQDVCDTDVTEGRPIFTRLGISYARCLPQLRQQHLKRSFITNLQSQGQPNRPLHGGFPRQAL